ncbi:MAG: DNA-processing protein DprA [Actinobacteria bacterium]|nr:DNA-processing protein DprA [Actinomycetota bacterium]
MSLDGERRARLALSFLAKPGDPVLGRALRTRSAAEVLALVTGADADGKLLLASEAEDAALSRAILRWRDRLGEIPGTSRLAAWQQRGLRLIMPGDEEWPTQLDDLGDARPLVLWLRGTADLRLTCINSVAIVGSRAATGYGEHVAIELAAVLAERRVGVVSGGAFGIDAKAHRGALAGGGDTVAVVAGGLAYGYPQGNHGLFDAVAGQGVLISECPPETRPTRPGFLVRNRIIAALSRGTVVVEAALRSGALNSARHARELCRPVMAVPGPVTSEYSAGCHELIRDYGAMLVTCAADVLAHVALPGDGVGVLPAGPRSGPARARDVLDAVMAAVLEEVPIRGGRGTASIAVRAGVDLDTAFRCLGDLASQGFVERCDSGWRTRR